MPIVTLETLKSYFLNQYVPAYAQFVDLIDTLADSGGVSSSHDHYGGDGAPIPLAGMADLSQNTVIGRASGAGTGVPTAITQGSGGGLDTDKLDGMHITTSGAWNGGSVIPRVNGADGVMEIGKYIDFHAESTAAKDNDSRLYVAVPGSDGTQVLKVSNYGGVDGIIMNTGDFSGTSFPTGGRLWTNYPFFRTDLGWWCYYDGTRWLTMHEYQVTTSYDAWGTISASTGKQLCKLNTRYVPYVTRCEIHWNLASPQDASNYYQFVPRGVNAAYSAAHNIGSVTTVGMGTGAGIEYVYTITSPVLAYYSFLDFNIIKVGSAGNITATTVFLAYKLIVT